MLNVNEIRNLEDKWKRYKRKKYFKFFIYILAVFILALTFLLYFLGVFDRFLSSYDKTVLHNNRDIVANKSTSYKSKIKNPIKKNIISNKSNANSNIINKNNKIVIKEDKNKSKTNTKEKNNTILDKNSSQVTMKNSMIKGGKNRQKGNLLQLNTKFLTHIYGEKSSVKKPIFKNTNDSNKSENNFTKEGNKSSVKISPNKQKQDILPTKKLKKTKILISSKKIDKLKYLKERYDETGRAFYAILISKEYYKKKLYLRSLKWATIANSIDNLNEDSWIMFAKNKVKLKKKKDAINALREYLRVNNSKRVKIFLTNIKNGVFK